MAQAVGEGSGVGGIKDVFPIKNLTKEESEEGIRSITVLAFRALKNALYAASDYLQDQDDDDTLWAESISPSASTATIPTVSAPISMNANSSKTSCGEPRADSTKVRCYVGMHLS